MNFTAELLIISFWLTFNTSLVYDRTLVQKDEKPLPLPDQPWPDHRRCLSSCQSECTVYSLIITSEIGYINWTTIELLSPVRCYINEKIASLLSIDTYVWEAVKIKVLKCYVIFWLAKIFLWEAVKNKRMLCYVIFFDKLKKRFWINITVLYRGVPTPYISPVMASPVTSDIIHRLMIWIIRQDQVCLINIIRIRWFMQTNNMDLLLLYYICFINN